MLDVWQVFLSGLVAAVSSPEFAVSAVFTLLVVVVYHATIAKSALRRAHAKGSRTTAESAVPADSAALRNRLAALEAATAGALQNVGFVRFNAFPDVGSELSYALAVVDARGDGFVVSSIYSREEVRTYAKAVKGFAADKEVSGEERQALEMARSRSGARDSRTSS